MRRLSLLVLALALTCLSACGQDDSSTTVTEAQRPVRANGDTDQQQAKETSSGFYAIFGQGGDSKTPIDSRLFCEAMSEAASAQTIHYAEISSGIARKWDCESAIDLLMLRSKRAGGFRSLQQAEVIGVNTEGDRATATIRFGNGPVTSVPLVKEDGKWKLAATPIP